jgi:phage regulator Rha-like protein
MRKKVLDGNKILETFRNGTYLYKTENGEISNGVNAFYATIDSQLQLQVEDMKKPLMFVGEIMLNDRSVDKHITSILLRDIMRITHHKHLMTSIRKILKDDPEINPEWIFEIEFIDDRGKKRKAFKMNVEGFLLVLTRLGKVTDKEVKMEILHILIFTIPDTSRDVKGRQEVIDNSFRLHERFKLIGPVFINRVGFSRTDINRINLLINETIITDAYFTSFDVADMFIMCHSNVLQAIRRIINITQCGINKNFIMTKYMDKSFRYRPLFLINRNGLLALFSFVSQSICEINNGIRARTSRRVLELLFKK